MTAVDRIVYYRYSIIAALGYMYTVPQYTMSRDFSRKLDREGGRAYRNFLKLRGISNI